MLCSKRWNTSRRGPGGNHRRISIAVVVLALCLPVHQAPSLPAADKIEGILSVPDVLTSPGKQARLEAKLVRPGIFGQPGLGGEQVDFSVGNRRVGHAMTGGDGRAFLEYTPRMRGNQTIVARLAGSPRVEAPEAKGTLFSWERRRPLLLVQTAALVEPRKSPALPIPTGPMDGTLEASLTPVPEAAVELKRLSEYFLNVVYVAWGGQADPGSDATMREWLERNAFPPGVKIRVSGAASALNEKLDELKAQGWDNVKAGIGRTAAFAEVLSERRIPVIIMPASDREEAKLPRKTAVIKGWSEVRKKLQG